MTRHMERTVPDQESEEKEPAPEDQLLREIPLEYHGKQDVIRAGVETSQVDPNLSREFIVLVSQWRTATRYVSSANKMAMHPAYQAIIALGGRAVPLILRDLEQTRSHWLWALYILSKFQGPAPEGATFDEAVDAWLNWGRQRGLLA